MGRRLNSCLELLGLKQTTLSPKLKHKADVLVLKLFKGLSQSQAMQLQVYLLNTIARIR